ncbi:DUF4333 domain-containing protein [Rhodococcus sp. NPDC003318]|uniref:DUF4333 domain-containing protein n=1 Tax=Rhodococcus sp. NPDC003318 TaxID=3364503 RepID=UPI0036CF7F7C
MSGPDDRSNGTGEQVTPPGAPQPTTAIPQQQSNPQQWGQQAWSAQPQPYPQQYQQYPQQGQYPQAYPQQPQYQYPPQGQQYQYPAQGQQYQYPAQGPTGQFPAAQYPQQPYSPYGQPQYGQAQYGQQPYPQYAPPAGAAPTSKTPLWIGLGAAAVLVIGVILAVVLVGGDTTLDQAAAERGVEQVLTGSYGITGIDDVSCPAGRKVEQGATFTCTLTVNGKPQSVTATFTDSEGKYEVSRPTSR